MRSIVRPRSGTERNGDEPAESSQPLDGQPSGPSEWCSIVFVRTEIGGEFRAVTRRPDGHSEVLARSRLFRIRRSRELAASGEVLAEHDGLVEHLSSLGWTRLPSSGRWHDTGFVRSVEGRTASAEGTWRPAKVTSPDVTEAPKAKPAPEPARRYARSWSCESVVPAPDEPPAHERRPTTAQTRA